MTFEPIIIQGVEVFTFDRILVYIGIVFTGIIALIVYGLQNKTSDLHRELLREIRTMTERIDSFTQQRAMSESYKKQSECNRIIRHLEHVKKKMQDLNQFLTAYNLGDTTNDLLKLFVKQNFRPITEYRIGEMKDATEQLKDRLKDNDLRLDFLSYIEGYSLLNEMIFEDNKPQNSKDIEGLNAYIDILIDRTQEFITKFHDELQETG